MWSCAEQEDLGPKASHAYLLRKGPLASALARRKKRWADIRHEAVHVMRLPGQSNLFSVSGNRFSPWLTCLGSNCFYYSFYKRMGVAKETRGHWQKWQSAKKLHKQPVVLAWEMSHHSCLNLWPIFLTQLFSWCTLIPVLTEVLTEDSCADQKSQEWKTYGLFFFKYE